MIKINASIIDMESNSSTNIEGYIKIFPEVGEDLKFCYFEGLNKVDINLGKIYNIKHYGFLDLIQTEDSVVEIEYLDLKGEITESKRALQLIKGDIYETGTNDNALPND